VAEVNLQTLDEESAGAFAAEKGLPTDAPITLQGRAASINVQNDAVWAICRELAVHGAVPPVMFASWWLNEDRVRAVEAFMRTSRARRWSSGTRRSCTSACPVARRPAAARCR
jgi:hypothetical protein